MGLLILLLGTKSFLETPAVASCYDARSKILASVGLSWLGLAGFVWSWQVLAGFGQVAILMNLGPLHVL